MRYFSHEDQDKIFPRLRSAIGTPVQSCHPEKSVDKVHGAFAGNVRFAGVQNKFTYELEQ